MILAEQNILFFPRTMALGGTEKVVFQLCEVLKPLVRSITVCSCGGENVRSLEKLGIQHVTIPDIEDKSLQTILDVVRTLRRIMREKRITVIHTHHRMAAFYIAALGLYRKCVFINTSHNTFSDRKALTAFAYRHAHVIACGEMVQRNLTEFFGLPASSVTVIRNSVQAFDGRISPDKTVQAWHDAGCFVVGNVGRLSEQKGMKYFLQAIPSVVEKHPEARFMVIGSGEEEPMLRMMAKELGIESYLYFTGYRTDVQNLMGQLDLIVLSSLWEGMPLTPLEAFSMKKTVVATAVDGTLEIVRDGENGRLVPPKDAKAIANNVIDLIEHPEQKKIFEEEGYRTFQSDFSFEVFAKSVRNYFCHL